MKWSDRFKNNRDREDDDSELPEELRGKTPQQLAQELKDAKAALTAATEAETARQTLEQQLATGKTELEQTRQRLQQLEANHRPERRQQDDEEPSTIWTDPDKFIDDKTKRTQNIALASGIMSAKMYAMNQLAGRDAKIFKKYEKEVDQLVATYPAENQVHPMTWINALTFIKGQHDTEIAKAEQSSTDFFSESGSNGRGVSSDEPPPETKLTSEEEAMCDAMHWDKAGYLKQKKNMVVNQGERGSYARFSTPKRTA